MMVREQIGKTLQESIDEIRKAITLARYRLDDTLGGADPDEVGARLDAMQLLLPEVRTAIDAAAKTERFLVRWRRVDPEDGVGEQELTGDQLLSQVKALALDPYVLNNSIEVWKLIPISLTLDADVEIG